MVEAHGEAFAGQDGGQLAGQLHGALLEAGVVAPGQFLQGGQPGGHGHGVSGEGAGLVDVAAGGDALHDPAFPAVAAHGEAAADDLAQGGQVGGDLEPGLGAAEGHAEAGDDLVEDEQGAVLVAESAQAFQEAGLGEHAAHVAGHGLHDDAGHLVAEGFEQVFGRLEVVVRGEEGVADHVAGHPGRPGDGQGGHARAGRGQKTVVVAVVAALELDDLVASGVAAGQAQGAHGGLGAGVDHAQHLHGGDGLADGAGQADLVGAGGAEAGAGLHRVQGRGRDLGISVAQEHGAPAEHVVDELAALHGGHARSAGAGDEQGVALHAAAGPHRAVHAPGQHLAGFLEEFLGVQLLVAFFEVRFHGVLCFQASGPALSGVQSIGK